ncbi:MAG: hypothetical protein KHX03_04265 [Clostridium sp.]|nr:hypothetical protein [Clostridium sp.]
MFNSFSNSQPGQNYNESYAGNDCTIDGFCSIDPIVYSLMEVLLYELKQITYYYVKMQELGYENKKLKDKIINYLSLILVGYEFSREDFEAILKEIHSDKESVKESFLAVCEKKNIDCQVLKSNIKFEEFNLSSIVNQGEKQAILRNKVLKADTKNLYEIILNLIKSASIRLIEMKCYTDDYVPEEDAVLKLFNSLNFSTISEEKLMKKINDFAKINFSIHKKLHVLKEEYYGKIVLNEVEVGVEAGHSILVSGQNLKDFEFMLEATKDKGINVYTHNGLIVAHAYPKFEKYPHLKGHFQMSLDSVQFDFASFKGPVLVIRNFQYLLDRLYRGRLFTTNIIAGKGMTKIENKNFQPLIDAALDSNGFEHNHKIAEVKVGYDEKSVMEKVDKIIEKIKNKDIKHLLIVGLLNHSPVHSEYFEKLEKNLYDDYYVISATLPSVKENVLFLDSFFNSSLIYKILAHIKERVDLEKFPISLFITTCNLHTLSHLFNLRQLGVKNIYLPKCTSNVITPGMLKFLKEKFGFRQVSDDPVKDLKNL